MIFAISVLALMVGILLGQLSVWVALHRRFNIPLLHVWEMLTIESYRPPRPVKLIIAGNHQQFRQWLQSNVKYVSSYKDICGYNRADCEIIRVGEWWKNPFAQSYDIAHFERQFYDSVHQIPASNLG